jgi:hypothetical protein
MSKTTRSVVMILAVVAVVSAILFYASSSVNKALGADADRQAIQLFNGKDLTNFYTFLDAPAKGEKKLGRNNDPKKVFAVEGGAIRISGEVYGYLGTEKEYENYHLTVEFKWGEKTFPPRESQARDSGVLLHATGDDQVWPQCIECQMIEGGTGDVILVGGKTKTKLTAPVEQRGKQYYYAPGAPTREIPGGRINWFGRDLEWKDVKGYRGPKDVERPVGQWNVLECDCDGSSIAYKLNGVSVNGGTNASLTKGRILLQSEGAEVFFRKVELRPLGK